MKNIFGTLVLLLLTAPVLAQEPTRKPSLAQEPRRPVKLLLPPKTEKIIELQPIEGNVGHPLPKAEANAWWDVPGSYWGHRLNQMQMDAWAPYFGRTSGVSPCGR